jgi:hypothetical protein
MADTGARVVARLRAVKLLHTVVWVFFAGSTVAIIVCAAVGALAPAVVFAAIVGVEVLVLAVNDLQCPLTAPIARYRAMGLQAGVQIDDSDLYLVPRWLARHNKLVFGTLYLLGIAITAVRWLWG